MPRKNEGGPEPRSKARELAPPTLSSARAFWLPRFRCVCGQGSCRESSCCLAPRKFDLSLYLRIGPAVVDRFSGHGHPFEEALREPRDDQRRSGVEQDHVAL